MHDSDIDKLLLDVERRYLEVVENFAVVYQDSFLAHVRSLARWYKPRKEEPPLISAQFPKKILIAYAVCDVGCGQKEFIVDGGTQECQYCGSLMYRMETAEYEVICRSDPAQASSVGCKGK